MKPNLLDYLRQNQPEIFASFGDARLLKYLDRHFELRGGSETDRAAAREWCSLFLRDALPACHDTPPTPPQLATTEWASSRRTSLLANAPHKHFLANQSPFP